MFRSPVQSVDGAGVEEFFRCAIVFIGIKKYVTLKGDSLLDHIGCFFDGLVLSGTDI